jgi:putative pyrroloquinoline-quinone-binding quinoprotein
MSGEFENLVQSAANALVSAIATDSWKAVKRAFAAVVGHERQIDATRAELATRRGPDLARAQAELAREWVTRLRDVLEDQPGVAPDLQALLARLGVTSGPAITTVTQHADRGSTAGSVGGDVRGNTGDVYVGVRKVDKRRFRFSPLLFFGHAAKTHPFAASAVTLVTIGGVAGGVVVAHADAPHAASPPPAASSSGLVLTHAETGASWAQLGFGADRTSDQPDETRIGTGNVARLSRARTYHVGDNVSAPLIANGILYVDTTKLYAFDATGAAGCSAAPATCTPLWTAPTAYFDGMTVADGDVFVTEGLGYGVRAFSATGSENCSGTPKVCTPLWETSTNISTGPGFEPGSGSPVVANGVLYVPGYGDGGAPSTGGALVAAFDPAGKTGCSGTPVICAPMWTTEGLPVSTANGGSPAIANGVLYIANGATLYAFDAAGSTNCSGTSKVCDPLWTAAMPGAGPISSAPAVAGGVVYVGTSSKGLYAFDAAGSVNCSAGATAKTCAPLWTAPAPAAIEGTPAVADGVVYVVGGNGPLTAFAAGGAGNCPGTGTTKTCTRAPLWTSAAGALVTGASPAVANGVVYVSSAKGGAYAYDAAGSLRCSTGATAKTCSPLWSAPGTNYSVSGSLAVVNGVLFVSVSGNGTVYAYSL